MTYKYKNVRYFYTEGNVKFVSKVEEICNLIASTITLSRIEEMQIIKNDFFFLLPALASLHNENTHFFLKCEYVVS